MRLVVLGVLQSRLIRPGSQARYQGLHRDDQPSNHSFTTLSPTSLPPTKYGAMLTEFLRARASDIMRCYVCDLITDTHRENFGVSFCCGKCLKPIDYLSTLLKPSVNSVMRPEWQFRCIYIDYSWVVFILCRRREVAAIYSETLFVKGRWI